MQFNVQTLIQALPVFAEVSSTVVPVNSLAVISLSGKDAVSFLHSQLTIDIEHLSVQQACFGAYCTAKGRVISTLMAVKTEHPEKGDSVHLIVHSSLVEILVKKLKMFILRAKVQVELGLWQVFSAFSESQKSSSNVLLSVTLYNEQLWIAAPSLWASTERFWVLVPASATEATFTAPLDGKPLQVSPTLSGDHCLEYDAVCGYFWTHQAHSEQYIPQTLNLDTIGGVHFKKGCYPGQEIVARTHYLGKIKRRMFLAQWQEVAVDRTVLSWSKEGSEDVVADIIFWFEPQGKQQWALIESTLEVPEISQEIAAKPSSFTLVRLPISYEKPQP